MKRRPAPTGKYQNISIAGSPIPPAKLPGPPAAPTRPLGPDTSADGVIGCIDHKISHVDAARWHRKVIDDMERWVANNPGIPLTQGRH